MDGVIVAYGFLLKPPQARETCETIRFLRQTVDFAEPLVRVAEPFLPVIVRPFGFGIERTVIAVDVVIREGEVGTAFGGTNVCGCALVRFLDPRHFPAFGSANQGKERGEWFCREDVFPQFAEGS